MEKGKIKFFGYCQNRSERWIWVHQKSCDQAVITLIYGYLPHITHTHNLTLNNSKYNHTFVTWGFGVMITMSSF